MYVPVGFRFQPTDEELIYYLVNRADGGFLNIMKDSVEIYGSNGKEPGEMFKGSSADDFYVYTLVKIQEEVWIRRGRGNVSSSPSKKECSEPPPHCGNETAYSWKSAPALETDAQPEKKRRRTFVSALETEESDKFKNGIENFFNNPANTQLLGDLDSKVEYLLGLSDSDYAAIFSNDDQYEASSEIGIAQQREYMEPPQHGDTTEDITRFEQFENALEYFTNPANSQLLRDLMVDEPPQHGDTTEDVANF
ncbi:hypothetical protein IFM89_018153 [Coptis chinensis]|uniref:NAC domain-containing protein n=1 Tax=Coptis chinensis TaxID=261450 RepID=A0A835HX18_9MAGN|nr:hypothetical protein IFM89_018153 [Coptis chinensis]